LLGLVEEVKKARRKLRSAEEALLVSAGWEKLVSDYDRSVYWSHPDTLDGTWMSRATAVAVAMGELEAER